MFALDVCARWNRIADWRAATEMPGTAAGAAKSNDAAAMEQPRMCAGPSPGMPRKLLLQKGDGDTSCDIMNMCTWVAIQICHLIDLCN